MQFVGPLHPLWLALGLVLVPFCVFVAISRVALARFSRKTLLDSLPASCREAFEAKLAHHKKYERTLDRLDVVLRLLAALFLCASHFFGVILQLRASVEPEFPLPLAVAGTLVVVLGILCGNLLVLEVLPTIIGGAWPEAWLRRFLTWIVRLESLVVPVRWLYEKVPETVARILGTRRERTEADILQEEILSVVEEGERQGHLESSETDMIESIISFGDVEVADVMTPRTEMFCLDLYDPLDSNLQAAMESGFSRIPVYLGSKDTIAGILYVKDLVWAFYRRQEVNLSRLVRKPYFVPSTKKIDELLQEFKAHRLHIAVVLDEFGGIAGLVTIEDILEEIVGEISDEFEKEEQAPIQKVSDDLVEVEASVRIDDLNDELDLELPESETYDTLGGFIFAQLGRVPAVGDTYERDGIRFLVTNADERRVHRLRLQFPRGRGATSPASSSPPVVS